MVEQIDAPTLAARADALADAVLPMFASRGNFRPPVSKIQSTYQCPRWLRGSTKCGSWPGMTSLWS